MAPSGSCSMSVPRTSRSSPTVSTVGSCTPRRLAVLADTEIAQPTLPASSKAPPVCQTQWSWKSEAVVAGAIVTRCGGCAIAASHCVAPM